MRCGYLLLMVWNSNWDCSFVNGILLIIELHNKKRATGYNAENTSASIQPLFIVPMARIHSLKSCPVILWSAGILGLSLSTHPLHIYKASGTYTRSCQSILLTRLRSGIVLLSHRDQDSLPIYPSRRSFCLAVISPCPAFNLYLEMPVSPLFHGSHGPGRSYIYLCLARLRSWAGRAFRT